MPLERMNRAGETKRADEHGSGSPALITLDGHRLSARAVARGQKMGRPFKLTDHQKREAIKRRDQGETLADIARS